MNSMSMSSLLPSLAMKCIPCCVEYYEVGNTTRWVRLSGNPQMVILPESLCAGKVEETGDQYPKGKAETDAPVQENYSASKRSILLTFMPSELKAYWCPRLVPDTTRMYLSISVCWSSCQSSTFTPRYKLY